MFSLMNNGEIRREEGCLSIEEFANHKVIMIKCIDLSKVSQSKKRKARLKKRLQVWKHLRGGQIMNEKTNLCLSTESLKSSNDLRAVQCNKNDLYQIWWFHKYSDLNVKAF